MTSETYVFLTDGDIIQADDEYYNNLDEKWVPDAQSSFPANGETFDINEFHPYRRKVTPQMTRPIATPSYDNDDIHVWDMYMRDLLNNVAKDGISWGDQHEKIAKNLGSFVDEIMKVRPKHG